MKWIFIFLYALLGICVGFYFVFLPWTPLLRDTPHEELSFSHDKNSSFSHIAEADKRAFFRTLYETFESENPNSEKQDSQTAQRPSDEELRRHYERFDRSLIKVRAKGCPIKQVMVPTRWQNREAIDRKFQIFDLEQC